MRILVTGGAGFIGSAVVRHLIRNTSHEVLNFDKLTYAGHLSSVAPVAHSQRYRFVRADICDSGTTQRIINEFEPDTILHLAAESHVDRSIADAWLFMQTNVFGTYTLLEAVRKFWDDGNRPVRFIHVSTDEVFGSAADGTKFNEGTFYNPSSPYSASKAASDHLVLSWRATYGLPVTVTNCSNNYGPFQYPEKLIPRTIARFADGQPMQIHGNGKNIRDWLFVEDQVNALIAIADRGTEERYVIGANNERTNEEVIRLIAKTMGITPKLEYVEDRPGNDTRYAIDATKIMNVLAWLPYESFESGIRKTVDWYLENEHWWRPMLGVFDD